MRRSSSLATWLAVLGLLSGAQAIGAENLLRNGSFEGSLLYWHNIEPAKQRLVRGDAAAGEYSFRIESGNPMSAPFACEPGKPFTVSFFVKADRDGEVHVQMPPSAREDGQKAKRLWVAEGTQTAKIDTHWKRISFTAKADVPQSGFWPKPHYMVQFEGSVPLQIDGVTVVVGDKGIDQYVPRRGLEVIADCPDLSGYVDHGNLLDGGSSVRLRGLASNPGTESKDATIRWQFIDYEGERVLAPPIDRRETIPPGKTIEVIASTKLPAHGCVLARVSAIVDGREVDRSELPMTSLPYPMSPRKPDPRERFGGSFFGPKSATLGSRMGFAWSRWYPHTKWQDHQPDGPDSWHWFDKELDLLEGLGISSHLVMYGWPKWIMDDQHPLPKDMRWAANDPRWDDLKVETAWDLYIKTAAAHYRGRAVIYEIENEPEFDRWDKFQEEYAKFTVRTARLIKQIDPKARVMVNNVYAIPSGINRHLLEKGGATDIDIISWHDYHDGWLSDAQGIRRMRAALDALGGKHIEIWFNEGWAYTNTAVDEPLACTGLTASQSTNAMACSVAEMTVAGQEKTILFHTGYEDHGMSFWDYSGPGTMLWDWYGYPLPLAAAWNTLAHHVGLSERIGLVRPAGANLCIFQNLRNHRGVIVAYADREATSDATIELPFEGLIAEDIMGNATPVSGHKITLSKTGRPVLIYTVSNMLGQAMLKTLEPLDRSHASFISQCGSSYHTPATWEGRAEGSTDGNPAMADGKPIWRLDQVWPPEPEKSSSYRPLSWSNGWWLTTKGNFGGQPKVEMKDGNIRLEFRAPHSASPGEKIAGLTFIAPKAGTYRIEGTAELKLWDGNNPVRMSLWHKTKAGARELAKQPLEAGRRVALGGFEATLKAGDELVLLPRIDGMFTGGDVTLRDLNFRAGSGALAMSWGLPLTWAGTERGTNQGNPIAVEGKPVWRLDQLWPDDPIYPANYRPLFWNGTEWVARDHTQGSAPQAQVTDGTFQVSALGAWQGFEYQKTAALVFIVPKAGTYRIQGVARTKPWEGGAKSYRLGIFQKDTQRVVVIKTLDVPRDDSPVSFEISVSLAAGHEVLFLPLMPDWNNATTTRIEGLRITLSSP